MTDAQFRTCALFAIVFAAFLAYGNTLTNDFVWDDVSSVLLHRHVQDPGKLPQLFKEDFHAFGRGQGNFYRPLLAASFMLDFALSRPDPQQKLSPVLFHITNILWHAAAAALFLALLRRFRAPRPVCITVPLLFAVHPLNTQAVAYISGRGDPMAAAFLFAALWFSLWEGTPARRVAGCAAGAACFVAAVLSKESAAVYPFLLTLLALLAPVQTTNERPSRSVWRGRAGCVVVGFLLTAGYAWLRATVLRFADDSAPLSLGFVERGADALKALSVYVKLLLAPTHLHMDRTLDPVPQWAIGIGALLLILCVAGFLLSVRYGHRRLAAGLGWFLLTWFPISGLIPLNAQIAEHWMYLPMAGFLWAAAEGIWALMRGNRVVQAAAAVLVFGVLLLFLGATAARNRVWRDNETLFRDTLAKSPASIRAHFNLAVTYEDILHNVAGARRHYERVIALYKDKKSASDAEDQFWPDELEAHLSLGRIYAQRGDLSRAAGHFSVVLNVEPNEQNKALVAQAAVGMGQCFLAAGEPEKAQTFFDRAVQLSPGLEQKAGSVSPDL